MRRLNRQFFTQPTLDVARSLIGCVLVHVTRAGKMSGTIVETEAYIGEDDPACHASSGLTKRNKLMYGTPGYAYIYLNYGIHHLLNVVTEPRGVPAAVLIRALVPLEGIPEMQRRRQRARNSRTRLAEHELCRGPGNLTRALGIDLRQNGLNLCEAQLHVESGMSRFETIGWSERVGIRVGTDRNWRCFAMDQVAVSKPMTGVTISGHPAAPEQFAPRSQINRHPE